VHSVGHGELLAHVTMLGRIATTFELPVVLSAVYVKHGMSGTNVELREALPGVPEIDRTTMNSWEDSEFRAAVERSGRKKLIIAGLWTEVCVAFPTLDALRAGYEVYVVVDAIGGVSRTAHESAMQRMIQAGATPISVLGLACELQRDWGRPDANRLRAIMREYFGALKTLKG
jgi:nicotinamidase-related amidase